MPATAARTIRYKRPITLDDLKDWASRYPDAPYVPQAFSGCWDWCHFDLSTLPYSQQKPVLLAALNADPPRRRENQVRRAAAKALVRVMQDCGRDHELSGDWAKLV
jgi:hypothetical protein